VIGGLAVIQAGYIRATSDVDILFLRSPKGEAALASALQEMKAEYITDEKDPLTGLEKGRPVDVKYIQGNHLMMLWTQYGALDIFDYVPGWPDSDPWKLKDAAVSCDGVLYASRSDITKMKLKAARPKDIADIAEIGEYETPEARILADILIGDENSLNDAIEMLKTIQQPQCVLDKAIGLAPDSKRETAILIATSLKAKICKS
jgi:hypothetical protein